jgi:trk system potassium uptake protein TrkH
MVTRRLSQFSPGRIIFISFFITIVIGTLCLALPSARTQSISFLDLLFTATSATCVTGLFTVPLDHFTSFGHAILLALIQIGGLGLITLSIFLMSLFIELGFTLQLMAGRLLDLEGWQDVRRLLITTVIITITFELIGAVSMFWVLIQDYPLQRALFLSLFHSISAFCNSGITLFGHSLITYNEHYLVLIITMLLMLCGGLGFVTWNELRTFFQSWRKKKRYHFSLYSKLVFYGTITGVAVSALIIFLTEYHHAFAGLSLGQGILYSLFHAISSRSAGFLLVPLASFQLATIFLTILISFVGSSPTSTGSGVKITTFILFLTTLKATILGKTAVELHNRQIPDDQIHKALTIVCLGSLWIVISTFFLLLTQQNFNFFEILLEAASSFTTLGLSYGITPLLATSGKWILILNMIVGRIGSFALILALRDLARKRQEATEFSYPEERVILG